MTDEWLKTTTRPVKVAQIDTTAPNVARVWNYLVGGRDNFEADRRAARQLIAVAPVMGEVAPAARAFHHRVIRYLTLEAGIRQFLDIGTGMPTAGNTHEVAQETAPESRIVYVDNDPVVLAHARALLTSTVEGVTSYIEADAADPAAILAEARATLDFGAPVAVVLIDILNFIGDGEVVTEILATLQAALAPGSYLAVMHPASDLDDSLEDAAQRWNQMAATPIVLRSRAEVTGWTRGLDLVDPGVVPVTWWRPGDGAGPEDSADLEDNPGLDDGGAPTAIPLYGFVARKGEPG